jgi:hemerythrin superfamily protein
MMEAPDTTRGPEPERGGRVLTRQVPPQRASKAMSTAASAKKKAKAANGAETADAIELLKSDHRAVEDLFAQYEKAGKAQKAKLAGRICMELVIHTTIEEEIFYPACRGEVDDDLMDEGYVEHDGAKLLVAEVMAGSPDEPFFDAKVKVLSEMIKHHVKEEEQRDGMFAQAKRAGLDLDELGRRLAARKKELKAAYGEGGVPAPTTRTVKGGEVHHGEPLDA